MNRPITRRELLRYLAAGLGAGVGGWFLSACGQRTTPLPPSPTTPAALATSAPPANTTVAPSAVAATATPAPTTSAGGKPDLVVARGSDPEQLVIRALAAWGGMERFVPPGADVIIKPNICVAYHTYEYAATTNPWVVGALVKLCLAAGARRVRVMDFPFGGGAEEAYVRSGIQEQVAAAGGEMELMSDFKFVNTQIPQGLALHKTAIYDEILNADVLINVPIAKDHGSTRLTLGMKNLMGVVRDRQAMHRSLGQQIADLNTRVRPTLTVVDAIRILMANGPTGGDLNDVRQMDTVIVSPDIVAADSYAATLFDLQPREVPYIDAAAEMGLGIYDLEQLRIEELSL